MSEKTTTAKAEKIVCMFGSRVCFVGDTRCRAWDVDAERCLMVPDHPFITVKDDFQLEEMLDSLGTTKQGFVIEEPKPDTKKKPTKKKKKRKKAKKRTVKKK